MGLEYNQALDLPRGELLSLIAVEQIKREGYRLRRWVTDDEEAIPDVL